MADTDMTRGEPDLHWSEKVQENSLADRVRRSVCSRQEAESYVSAAESAFGRLRSAKAMTAEQQIRALALEWAVTLYVGLAHGDPSTVLEQAEEFETYIREGK